MLSISIPKLQNFMLEPCSTLADDGGCSAVALEIRQQWPLGCLDEAKMGVAGNVSAGSIVGVPLVVNGDGGPDSASVYFEFNSPSGSTGANAYAQTGTVTFTVYEFAPDGGTGRVAGTLSVNNEAPLGGGGAPFNGPISGTFDSANPDCTCSSNCQ